MDTETNPIESELVEPSEPSEPSEAINENGCDDIEKPKVIEAVTHVESDDKEADPSIGTENNQKHGDDSESSPLKASTEEPIILCASETEPLDVIDSDASQNNSPEKNAIEPAPVAELDVVETKQLEAEEVQPEEVEAADELPVTEAAPCNDQIQPAEVDDVDEPADALQVDSSPEKSGSEMACLIPSPSDPMNDSANEKSENWEPIEDVNYDDSEEEDDENENEDDDDSDVGVDNEEFSKRSNPKTVEQKTNNDCQVFELTDDNSSVDDARESDAEDDIEMGEEEEEEEDEDDEPRSGKK